jgi:hypothetical protein
VNSLAAAIEGRGGKLSLSQVSKTLKALEQDLVIDRSDGVALVDPIGLLKKLGREFRLLQPRDSQLLRIDPDGPLYVQPLNDVLGLGWAVSGESSVQHHGGLVDMGPQKIVVRDLRKAVAALVSNNAAEESIRNFASIELLETDNPSSFFSIVRDGTGVRWASEVQTWLELQDGGSRQQDAAYHLRERILRRLREVCDDT